MGSLSTLTSLAMLKAYINEGMDYLEFLRPFIIQILIDHDPKPINDVTIKEYLLSDYGLEIPIRPVHLILRRLSGSNGKLRLSDGVYRVVAKLPDPKISIKKALADHIIESIIMGLLNFRLDDAVMISTREEAIAVLLSFLSEFSIPCLRSYLRGTAIPDIADKKQSDIVIVSRFVLSLQQGDPQGFADFMVLVQGHMLANAILCPDLRNAPKSFRSVTFYLDTPLLIHFLGLDGEEKENAFNELISLLQYLGGSIAVFSHTIAELRGVISGAALHLDDRKCLAGVVIEARKRDISKADLILMSQKLEDTLNQARIDIIQTPKYDKKHQMDEIAFQHALDEEVSYFNPRARDHDINSVRCIYLLRRGQSPISIEKCSAIFVTSNEGFARAAYDYGQEYEESIQVTTVITDFSLANVAWLKAPMSAPSLPMIEVLSFAFAALQPSRQFLEKYLREIDKLEASNKYPEEDLQLLRSAAVDNELMDLTRGEETALTKATLEELLDRVKTAVKKEAQEALERESQAHDKTRKRLEEIEKQLQVEYNRKKQRCLKKAKYCTVAIAIMTCLVLLAGIVVPLLSKKYLISIIVAVGAGLLNFLGRYFGISVVQLNSKIKTYIFNRLLKTEEEKIKKL